MTDRFDEKVVGLLKGGAVGFMPSDTIYGLSCRALDESAVIRLHKIKERDKNKPFIVLIPSMEILNKLSVSIDRVKPAEKYWPGPLTLKLTNVNVPPWLDFGTKTFAFRMPNQKDLLALMQKVGPIISTSANLQGEAPLASAAEAKKIFGDKLDFYVDTGELSGRPSTLVVNEDGKLKVIRQGAVKINGPE